MLNLEYLKLGWLRLVNRFLKNAAQRHTGGVLPEEDQK
jgi:hypothetical protein